MELQDLGAWSWETLSDDALDAAVDIAKSKLKDTTDGALTKVSSQIREAWTGFQWSRASQTYRENLRNALSTTRVLGNPKPIDIENIYTDVYVHDRLSATRRFAESIDLDAAVLTELEARERFSALEIAREGGNLFILGRPGAGKTTFLKYLAILACKENIRRTPIFVSLKDWSDSSLSLVQFIAKQFDICGFPNAEPFVLALLKRGDALVLLDGLDEVNEWQSKRTQTVRETVALSRKYSKCQFCLTCRIAASDYSFDAFRYVEVADFTLEQQLKFVKQWYGDNKKSLQRFTDGWTEAKQSGLRELGKTPLLLTLLCLAFDETLQFPERRVDLYQDALDALLRKWDTSRLIVRDDFYKKMSHSHREHLLQTVAAKFYFDSRVAFRRPELEAEVLRYLSGLPDKEVSGRADAATVIRQVEAQHGIIVERAAGIFSFSHLTIQEYLTAVHILAAQDERLLDQVAQFAIRDSKWREVMLFTVGQMPSADRAMASMVKHLNDARGVDMGVLRFLAFNLCLASEVEVDMGGGRKAPLQLLFGKYHPTELKERIQTRVDTQRHPPLTSSEMEKIAEQLQRINAFLTLKEKKYHFGIAAVIIRQCHELVTDRPSKAAALLSGYFARPDNFIAYLYGCQLVIECLEVGVTHRRDEVLSSVMSVDEKALDIVASDVGYASH